MSVALFDLGHRLRAAAQSRPVARSTFAPVLAPVDPVAVTVTGTGDHVWCVRRLACDRRQRPGRLLAELGVSGGPGPRTMVVADRDTHSHLLLAGTVGWAFIGAGGANWVNYKGAAATAPAS